jgi:hypothetical protein
VCIYLATPSKKQDRGFKINVAVQAIADAPVPEDETAVADGVLKPEETRKPQEIKTEPSESITLESTETNADQPQSVIKSENTEPTDPTISTDSTDDVTPMTVDKPILESERGRTSERHESQAVKLKRLATKVFVQVTYTVPVLIEVIT